jgi:hypothetical protein
MKKLLIEKDIQSTIRLLRYLTHGEGYASISLFDAGAGGGFSWGTLNINLERSGLIFNGKGDKTVDTPQELFNMIKSLLSPFDEKRKIEVINDYYKRYKWNE